MNRRNFLRSAAIGAGTLPAMADLLAMSAAPTGIMTVRGPMEPENLGITLIHEHLMADFIGAAETGPHRYKEDDVVKKVLPYLQKVKAAGCNTMVECTATFLGRDVKLAKRLSIESGVNILTNTGNYSALKGKFVPAYAHQETARELAARWIDESKNGIEKTDIFPGFMKIGVDEGPLLPIGRKLVEASAITHLETGLSISGHTGDGKAAMQQLDILTKRGVDPSAFRWVHAQNEKDKGIHLSAARLGAYVEFDGIRPDNIAWHVECVKAMKANGFLNKTLVSQDAGWYWVGEPNGGEFVPYTMIFELFVPALEKEGFSKDDIRQLLVTNPMESLTIRVRKYR